MPGDGVVDPREVAERVHAVRERVAALGSRRVALVAVTKSFGVEAIRAAAESGCDAIGENYAQELLEKVAIGLPDVPVHFIGHIQSNKVRALIGHVDLWQSVDRGSVVREIARRGAGGPRRVLLQVNTTAEPQKGGADPGELDGLLEAARSAGLTVEGLMTMGPTSGSVGETEAAFRLLRTLVDRTGLETCSMGMSDDYEIAVACGSTMVRIGSALFGPRAGRGVGPPSAS